MSALLRCVTLGLQPCADALSGNPLDVCVVIIASLCLFATLGMQPQANFITVEPFDVGVFVIALLCICLVRVWIDRQMRIQRQCCEAARIKHKLLDPSSGVEGVDKKEHIRSFDPFSKMPNHPHEEAVIMQSNGEIISNNSTPVRFDNEFCSGSFFSLHRPTYDKALDKSGNYPFSDHFAGKRRLWEARIQMKFKKPPRVEDFFFGMQLDEYVPMNCATKAAMKTMIAMLKRVVGDNIYHSAGDDPKAVTGSVERPCFVMPLLAFDQFIVTPDGEEPPLLSDARIADMGSKRATRVRDFKQEIDALNFQTGTTYTFCFWGISQFLDKLSWEIKGIPLITPLSMNKFCGKPPVHLVFYTLKSSPEDSREHRHVESRKNYYFDTAFWSSQHRPSDERIQQLTAGSEEQASMVAAGPKRTRHPSAGGLLLQMWPKCLACWAN